MKYPWNMPYLDQLKTPEWEEKRELILNQRGWQCEWCGQMYGKFDVHHLEYLKSRLAWQYADKLLAVLCRPCHDTAHRCKVCKKLKCTDGCEKTVKVMEVQAELSFEAEPSSGEDYQTHSEVV